MTTKSDVLDVVAITGAVLFVFWPWLLVVLELVWWFWTGHNMTGLDWASGRWLFALAWPFIIGSILASTAA